MIEIHSDGYTIRGNPSKIGGGFTIVGLHADGREELLLTHKILRNPILFGNQPFTNNEGELLGVLFAAVMAPVGMKIITDSHNTEAWVKSASPKARPDLKWLCVLAQQLIRDKALVLEWRPREVNLAGQYNEFKLHV